MIRAIYAVWIVLLLLWLLTSLFVKSTRRRQPAGSRAAEVIFVVVGFWLIFSNDVPFAWLHQRVWSDTGAAGIAGLAVTMAGALFAIWARFSLGRNWSGSVTVKHGHELQRSGPYAIVRHPIYSGLLLALLGTAIGFGEVSGFLGVLLTSIGWRRKSLSEEQFMLEEFGDQYRAYRRDVKALIPFVY